jgi:predicted GIY-YIG superfamily endonuclease
MKIPDQTRAFAIYVFGPSPAGKFYVGQTEDLKRRFGTHLKAQGECPEFHRAVQLYGLKAFPLQIAAETDVAEEADRLESLFITKFNSLIPHGYNLTLGGRAVRFQPGLKVVGFTEHPVSAEEMRLMAQRMADEAPYESLGLIVCPCCGEGTNHQFPACRCGVVPDFSRWILRAMASGCVLANLPLCDDAKLLKKWRASRDSRYFSSMHKYAARFWPYIESAVRRRCLVEKRLPCYQLGQFKPLPGGRIVEMKKSQIKGLLHQSRHQLSQGEANIKVFAKILGWQKEQNGKLFDAVISTLLEHGGSEAEIREARRRTLFYRDVERELADFLFLIGQTAHMRFKGEKWSADVTFPSLSVMEDALQSIIVLPPTDRRSALLKLVEFPPPNVTLKRITRSEVQAHSLVVSYNEATNSLAINWGNAPL